MKKVFVKHKKAELFLLVMLALSWLLLFSVKRTMAEESIISPEAKAITKDLEFLGVRNLQVESQNGTEIVYRFKTLPDQDQKARLHGNLNGFSATLYDKQNRAYFSLEVEKSKQYIAVTLIVKGRGSATFHRHTGAHSKWVLEEGDEKLLLEYGQQLKILADLWALQEIKQTKRWYNVGKLTICGAAEKLGINICTGRWDHGGAFSTRRSMCCIKAKQAVDSVCGHNTPGVCVQCCDYRPCDAACLIGDYYCECTKDGRECGQIP